MITTWYEFNVSLVASVANLTLSTVLLVYLLSLPDKKLEAKLFSGYFITICFFYLGETFIHLVTYPPFHRAMIAFNNIVLAFGSLLSLSFAYQSGGNPFKREFFVIFLILGSLLVIPLFLLDLGTYHFSLGSVHFLAVIWVSSLFGRKAVRAEREAGRHAPVSIMLRGFQKWTFIIICVWLIALFSPFEYLGYLTSPLNFIQITYATIVFLNYTPQPTSFQAKVVGLVLCPLLIILVLTPLLLQQFIVDLPNYNLVNHQVSATFLILIPLTALAVIVGLPRFLRSNLLSPLNKILDGVRQVDTGNLLVQVPESVNDEVGQLARQFNNMTRSLHRYGSEMESLVEERTNQLQHSLDNLKSTQSQLIQQEKLASLGQLTAGIAHEIKNPLNFVNNFSEVSIEMIGETLEEMEKREGRDETLIQENLEDIQSNLQKIHEHGSRANSIVTSMLQHSKGGSGKKEPTDLNALIQEYVNLSFHGMRAGKNPINVDIAFHLDPEIVDVPIIKEDFTRVVINLCNNAFDAMRGKKYEVQSTKYQDKEGNDINYLPKLRVSTTLENGQVRISFEDNGPGIPDEIKDKILQPFFTTKKGTEGTGLGLSITNDIIKAHGGELEIETTVNKGTKFIIKLTK